MKTEQRTKAFAVITAKKIDCIFVAIFFLLLFIPMSKISREDISKKENRVLAKHPTLLIENHFNDKFTSEFESWFNDRFNGRRALIRLNSKLTNKLTKFAQNKKVLIGRENWLFYKGDHSLDNFQNKTLFTPDELNAVGQYLSDIDHWAKSNNKSFYFVIAPDKNKIYGEYITSLKKIRPDSESRAHQLIKHLTENTKVNVIYPHQTLLNNKDKGLLYYKHDTHWNDLGTYLAYEDIINTIKKNHPQIAPVQVQNNTNIRYETGDLFQMLNYSIEKDQSEYIKPEIIDHSVCIYNSDDQDETKGFQCSNKLKKLNVITFRDSFTDNLVRYYNNTFKKVKYEWHYDITKENLEYIKKNADIIILETVERFIPSLVPLKFPED